MDIRVSPSRLSGALDAVSSKSAAHRLLVCAALAGKGTRVRINGISDDIQATIRCLELMGAEIKIEKQEAVVRPIQRPVDGLASAPLGVLRCGESATAARLLMPVAAALFDSFSMTGEGTLPMRPLAPLCLALQQAGCKLDGDRLPLAGSGRITAGDFHVPGDISSQFVSGLLLALPLLSAESRVRITTPLESASYVKMTVEAIAFFGIAIEKNEEGYRVIGNRRYDSPGVAVAEGDWSNSAFFLCMGALGAPGCSVTVRGLAPRSEQGDKKIVEILRRFGASVQTDETSVTVSRGALRGISIDAAQIPDLVPALAVVASLAEGESKIYNARRLHFKESDRLQSTRSMLLSLGADVKPIPDGLAIRGKKKLRGGEVSCARDHRIVMAAATAACACEKPVVVKDFLAVNKSYPAFFGHYKTLGGFADVF